MTTPLEYMSTLPEGRRVFHCDKHQLYQPECEACKLEYLGWKQRHEEARHARAHESL